MLTGISLTEPFPWDVVQVGQSFHQLLTRVVPALAFGRVHGPLFRTTERIPIPRWAMGVQGLGSTCQTCGIKRTAAHDSVKAILQDLEREIVSSSRTHRNP